MYFSRQTIFCEPPIHASHLLFFSILFIGVSSEVGEYIYLYIQYPLNPVLRCHLNLGQRKGDLLRQVSS